MDEIVGSCQKCGREISEDHEMYCGQCYGAEPKYVPEPIIPSGRACAVHGNIYSEKCSLCEQPTPSEGAPSKSESPAPTGAHSTCQSRCQQWIEDENHRCSDHCPECAELRRIVEHGLGVPQPSSQDGGQIGPAPTGARELHSVECPNCKTVIMPSANIDPSEVEQLRTELEEANNRIAAHQDLRKGLVALQRKINQQCIDNTHEVGVYCKLCNGTLSYKGGRSLEAEGHASDCLVRDVMEGK